MSPADRPLPGTHPDHDLLADLAAEVLPEDIAVQIQGHVMTCPDCADLLAEAEGIRALLRRSEPETMPDAVLGRLEATLVAARQAVQQGQDPAVVLGAPSGSLDRTGSPAGSQTPRSGPSARSGPPARSGAADGSGPAAPPPTASGGGPTRARRIKRATPGTGRIPLAPEGNRTISRLRGRSVEATGARRQARAEVRADRPKRLARLLPALRVAAVLVLVLGVGGLTAHLVRGGTSSGSDAHTAAGAVSAASAGGNATSNGSSSSVGSALEGGPVVLAPVQSTDTNYIKSDLPSQVKSLVTQSQKDTASGTGASGTGASGDVPLPTAAGTVNGANQDGSQLLRSQSALRSCLDAIGAGNQQPVAVDLARYAGQEAAIIVLNAPGGGYQVWVVARTCAQGADGTIAVVPVAAG